ncbi:MAG: pyridoxal phosphate-dependent aminotransferase [Acidobacteriota bacterium]|nr:pyridoxal phosphate-dependent aminotransferase [Acidobacteriota bacterium]
MFSNRTGWNLEHSKLSQALTEYRRCGKPLIDLTRSNPTECGFHYDSDVILQALNNPGSMNYEPIAQGLPQARAAVAGYYSARGSHVSVDDIFLTTGTSEAYSFLLRTLCNPGDEVLIPQPGYPLLNFLADLHDVTLVRYALVYDYGWQIDFHSLRQAITPRARAIVIVHPNNPTGHFCKAHEMEQLHQLCSEHQLALIADEVFLDFGLGAAAAPRSFVSSTEALTFTMSGLSKISGLPQMKLAWLVVTGPQQLTQQAMARLEMIADTYLSMNTPMQLALGVLMGQRHTFQKQCVQRVQNNLAHLDEMLSSQKLCARLRVEGGWYAVLTMPPIATDDELAFELLHDCGVYLHPGHFYDFPGNGYLVVSLIAPESEFASGIGALLEMLRDKSGGLIPGSSNA